MTTEKTSPPRVRMAPSPTGPLHWGTARVALFNWLFAKKNAGVFVVRLEDTDKERSKKEFEQPIFDGLHWLGLNWDEGSFNPDTISNKDVGAFGPYRSSERTETYAKYLEQLLKEKKAYYCYCTKEELEAEKQGMIANGLAPKYSGHCRNLEQAPVGKEPQVIRFKTPEVKVSFKDMIRGNIEFDAGLFGDFVIAKDTKTPLFHFAVVIDDYLMEISHIIRGEDHISNTPKHILLGKALNFTEPLYAHLPLVLGQNREKLSKRYLTSSLLDYRDQGYLPEAVLNFIVLLGWHPKGDQEVFTPEEMIAEFDIKKVQKGGAIFNEEKLLWLNTQHIRRLSVKDLAEKLKIFLATKGLENIPEEIFLNLVALEQPRMKTLNDFIEATDFFFKIENYSATLLIPKNHTKEDTLEVLRNLEAVLAETNGSFDRAIFGARTATLIEEKGRGAVLWPLRVALSGKAASPDPLDILSILSREEAMSRLQLAINKLNELA